MRRVGGLLLVAIVVAAALLWVPAAGAAEPPEFDGVMNFPKINGPSDPEEYSWRVELGSGQKLMPIVDGAAIVYKDGTVAFTIAPEDAHDAQGAAVPTTLAVTGPDVITLTVHHRAGNPAAGNASFAYPVVPGPAFSTAYAGTVTQEPTREGPPSVATHAPEHVLVTRALGEDKLYYRPHFFLLSGDGTFGVSKVQWQSYGGAVATATGRAFANDCIPYCAAGHIFKPQAKLTLSRIVQCQGHPVYSRLSYRLIGKLPKGLRRRGGDPMLPLGEDGKPDC
jgi:hypothetical protein